MSIIRKHKLTKYDDLRNTTPTDYIPKAAASLPKKEEIKMAVTKPVIVSRVTVNQNEVPAHNANSHKYLAIHYLGVNGENPDLYGGGYGGHFYVSKTGVCYQAALVTDKLWHVGASSGFRYIHPDARNTNTIGIECATYGSNGRWYSLYFLRGDFFGALLGALIRSPPFFMTTIVEWFLVLLLQ